MRYLLLDVFTKTALQGNPLAVFPSSDGIGGETMQQIANELNLSETVFLGEAAHPEALARARIFTPRRELDFAGHPTIGAAYVLAQEGTAQSRFAIEENVGLVPIRRERDSSGEERFWLTTPELTFFESLDPAFCARLLGLDETDIVALPQFVSGGSPLLFVALRNPEAVDRAALGSEHLPNALGSANSVGTFIFARKEPESPSCFDVYARMFAPQTGIAEDPATGGATGPLAGYMMRHGMMAPRDGLELTSEQGRKMGRPSYLHVRLGVNAAGTTIEVGGSAVRIGAGELYVE